MNFESVRGPGALVQVVRVEVPDGGDCEEVRTIEGALRPYRRLT
jgi:hypothetical protein